MNYLSMCAIVRDEEESYIHEWLKYHRALGFEHVYLYDNQSTIPLKETTTQYLAQGWLDVFSIPGDGVQISAYAHCLKYYSDHNRWIAFLDLDEFIVPTTAQDLRHFLEPYEPYGGLGISWLCFGSSGHEHIPGESQIKYFTYRTHSSFQDNRHIKSIVQPQYITVPVSPHHFLYRDNRFCVNEHFEPVAGAQHSNSTDNIRINHYFCRSRDQFLKKISRGRATGLPKRKANLFERLDNESIIQDQLILNIWDPDQQRLRKKPVSSSFEPTTQKTVPTDIPLPNEQDPHNFNVNFFLEKAVHALYQSSIIEAAEILSVLIAQYPERPQGYLVLSNLLIELNQHDEALKLLDEGYKNGVSNSELLCQRGFIYNQKNEYLKAHECFQQAHTNTPSSADVLIQLARNCLDMGNRRKAVECLMKVKQIDPDSPELQQAINILGLNSLPDPFQTLETQTNANRN